MKLPTSGFDWQLSKGSIRAGVLLRKGECLPCMNPGFKTKSPHKNAYDDAYVYPRTQKVAADGWDEKFRFILDYIASFRLGQVM